MGGSRTEGSAGRSHRRNSAGTWANQIRQEQQPNLVEPPRWFTARRKLVKFKSAFKTGLARCPAPPGAATAGKRYRRAPTGVYRSNILGKLWMDFPPQITAPLASCRLPSHPRLSMFFSQQGGSRRELFLPSCRKDARSRFPKERGGVIEADRFPLSKFKASTTVLEKIQYACVCVWGGVSNGSVRFELCQLNATSFHVQHSLSTLNIHRLMRYWNIEASTPITYICGHPVVDVTEIGSREILKRRNVLGR